MESARHDASSSAIECLAKVAHVTTGLRANSLGKNRILLKRSVADVGSIAAPIELSRQRLSLVIDPISGRDGLRIFESHVSRLRLDSDLPALG